MSKKSKKAKKSKKSEPVTINHMFPDMMEAIGAITLNYNQGGKP
jgi:hypothetical protein